MDYTVETLYNESYRQVGEALTTLCQECKHGQDVTLEHCRECKTTITISKPTKQEPR